MVQIWMETQVHCVTWMGNTYVKCSHGQEGLHRGSQVYDAAMGGGVRMSCGLGELVAYTDAVHGVFGPWPLRS